MSDKPRRASFWSALRETLRTALADDRPNPAELFKLVKESRLAEAREMLRAHPQSWYVLDEGGRSLLHWAAFGGHADFAKAAMNAGVPPDASSEKTDRQTPLMWAVMGKHVAAARTLLDGKADPMARDARGYTALIVAAQFQSCEVMDLLKERGGKQLLHAGDMRKGCCPVHWAAYTGSLEALTMLESLGADLRAKDAEGLMPLHHAVKNKAVQVASFLVRRGADPTVCASDGRSALEMAQEMRDQSPEVLACLLAAMLGRLLAVPFLADTKGSVLEMRTVCRQTPLAMGVAASWAEAWEGVAEVAAEGAGAEVLMDDVGAVEQPTAADLLYECSSFDLDYVHSLEQLREALAKQVEDARAILHRGVFACYVLTDRHGWVVDLLSQCPEELPPDRFPVHARLCGMRSVDKKELARLRPLIDTGVSRCARADPGPCRNRILTRIPPSFRWSVWKEVLRVQERQLPRGGEYSELATRENEWTQLILNDVSRTFTCFDRHQQQSLLRILNVYAMHNPSVGYCQGMNMIAGLLLLLSGSEEESFLVLACLMDHLGLAEFYREGFPLLRRYLDACDALMAVAAPELLEHFAKEGVELNMYLQQWFLTLFIDCLPLALVVTLWDAIICEGLPVALRVVVTILSSLKEPLLEMRFQAIANTFKTLRKQVDREGDLKAFETGQLIVRQAASVQVPSDLLAEHRAAERASPIVVQDTGMMAFS